MNKSTVLGQKKGPRRGLIFATCVKNYFLVAGLVAFLAATVLAATFGVDWGAAFATTVFLAATGAAVTCNAAR